VEIANLGDSGLRVVRDGKIIFATESLNHSFNMPFQLGSKKRLPFTDKPKNALVSLLRVQRGDVLIMASDGFFDNVWDSDIARMVKAACTVANGNGVAQNELAEQLAEVAARNSKDPAYRSPWSVEVARHKNVGILQKMFPKGGKVDDITVVVAQIQH
jgi:protein phosphatase PTC7